jgi:hypothetical protein
MVSKEYELALRLFETSKMKRDEYDKPLRVYNPEWSTEQNRVFHEVYKLLSKQHQKDLKDTSKEVILAAKFPLVKKKNRRVTDRDHIVLKFGKYGYWKDTKAEYDDKGERFNTNMLGFDYIDYFLDNLRSNYSQSSFVVLENIIRKKFPFHKVDGIVLKQIANFGYRIIPQGAAKSELTRRKHIRKYRHFKGIEHW